jgi:hypothetical protein
MRPKPQYEYLAWCQNETNGQPQGIGQRMDLTAEAASRTPQCLLGRRAAGRPGRTGIGTNDGAVDTDGLKVGVPGQYREKPVPDAEPAPAGEALENAVPCAEAVRQHRPLSATAQYPEHRIDKAAATESMGQPNTLCGAQQVLDERPLGISQTASVSHGKSPVLPLGLRQQNLATITIFLTH